MNRPLPRRLSEPKDRQPVRLLSERITSVSRNKQTAALVRVSSDPQDHERQKIAIRQYFLDRGEPVPAKPWWFEDKESRDLSKFRPDFQRLMKLVEQGKIDRIVIEKFDRFGIADIDEWFHWRHFLRNHGCKLISVTDGDLTGIDTPTMIKTFFMADASEKEQREKSRRVLTGKTSLAGEAKWQGGIAPYGHDKACYDSNGNLLWVFHYLSTHHGVQVFPCADCKLRQRSATGNKPCTTCQRVERSGRDMPRKGRKEIVKLVPSEDQQRIDIVQQIYRWYTGYAYGVTKVAKLCCQHGFKIYGNDFNHDLVTRILSNPANIGQYAYNRTSQARFYESVGQRVVEMPVVPVGKRKKRTTRQRDRKDWITRDGSWAAIIDRQTFDRTQRKMEERKKGPMPPRSGDSWLKGLLRCGGCGKPLVVRRIKGRVAYCCLSYLKAKQLGLACACGYNRVYHDDAEKLVTDRLAGLRLDLGQEDGKQAVAAMLEAKQETEADLARLIDRGIGFYLRSIDEVFEPGRRPDSKLARLLERFRILPGLTVPDSVEVHMSLGQAIVEKMRGWPPGNFPGRQVTSPEEAAEIIAEIERVKAIQARSDTDQLQAEYEAVVLAKAHCRSDRERSVLDKKLNDLEDQIACLEEHLVPLSNRKAELEEKLRDMDQRIREAEEALREAEPLAKAEAIRRVLSKVVLHFGKEKHGTKTFSPLLPEETEFVWAGDGDAAPEWLQALTLLDMAAGAVPARQQPVKG
jgi:DNA invertase Pin-like site-specific DNA recombinase